MFIKGIPASYGKAIGKVKIIKNDKDLENINTGDIIVIRKSSPLLSIVIDKISGIIVTINSIMFHAAIIARESSVPCIVGVENALNVLKEGLIIKIDADKGEITDEIE